MPAFLIPAIAFAIGAGSAYLKQRAANKSAEEQANLYNEWLANRQNGVNDIIEKLTAGGFDPFGAQTTTSTGSESSTSSTTQRQSSRPTITPEYAALESTFRNILQNRLSNPSSLPAGYAENAVRAIQASAAPGRQAIQNLAAQRGLNANTLAIGSPVERQAAGQIADIQTQIPLLNRSLQNEDLGMASGAISNFGRGTDSFGRSVTNSSGARVGSMTSPPNIGTLANLLLPPSPTATAATGSTAGAVGGDLASALLALWTSGALDKTGYGRPTGA